MKVAHLSSAAILASDHSLDPATYLQPTVRQEQRLAAARRKYREAIAGFAAVAKQRREIRARQKRLGIVEVRL